MERRDPDWDAWSFVLAGVLALIAVCALSSCAPRPFVMTTWECPDDGRHFVVGRECRDLGPSTEQPLFGGENFGVILPNYPSWEIEALPEALRK